MDSNDWFGVILIVVVLLLVTFFWAFAGGIDTVEDSWSDACVEAGYDWGQRDGDVFTCHYDVHDGLPLNNTGEA